MYWKENINCFLVRIKRKVLDMKQSVITIGNFDGVHLGHQAILNKVVDVADKENLKSIVVSFDSVINKTDVLLTTEQEKIDLLNSFSIDEILILKVSKKLVSTSADDFFEKFLVKKLNVKHIVVGYDAAFGKNREGNISWLKKKVKEKNIKLDIVKPVKINNIIISSSKIRDLIIKNKIDLANKMLGRFFEINGKHISGNKIGRTIGFPTINVETDKFKLLPKGVFGCLLVDKNNNSFFGLLNIGLRPTFKLKKSILSTEVHLLNFEGVWKQKNIKLLILKFIRKEKSFSSVDLLIKNIKKDIDNFKSQLKSFIL